MNLYLLRHGEAKAGAVSDEERGLTDRGREETGKVARWFKKRNPGIEVAISSPLLRARQTTDILVKELSLSFPIHISKSLSPDKSPEEILSLLHQISEVSVLLVGHLPILGYLMSGLVCGDDKLEVPIKKSSLSLIQLPEVKFGKGSLEWMVRPDIL